MKDRQVDIFRPAVKAGAWVILVSAVAVSITGDMDAKVMVQQQPMKMAAAEALYDTTINAPFSVLSIGDLSGTDATRLIEIPGLTSYLATGSFDGKVAGSNDLQAQYTQTYGPGNSVPYVPVTYWGFRLMIGLGLIAALYALWVLWRFRKGRAPAGRVFSVVSNFIVLGPLLAISAGWIFTEMGRQPWIVFESFKVEDAATTNGGVWITFLVIAALYAGVGDQFSVAHVVGDGREHGDVAPRRLRGECIKQAALTSWVGWQ